LSGGENVVVRGNYLFRSSVQVNGNCQGNMDSFFTTLTWL
jgi:hypothetical protein